MPTGAIVFGPPIVFLMDCCADNLNANKMEIARIKEKRSMEWLVNWDYNNKEKGLAFHKPGLFTNPKFISEFLSPVSDFFKSETANTLLSSAENKQLRKIEHPTSEILLSLLVILLF